MERNGGKDVDMNEIEFERLYESCYPWIRSVAYRMVGPNDFLDVSQEAFANAWRFRHSFRAQAQEKTWIYRIAVNAIFDFLRKKKRETESRSFASIDSFSSPQKSVSDSSELEKALGLLTTDERMLVVLHYFEDLPFKDISVVLKIPEGTVKSRLFAVREKLRDFMNPHVTEKIYEQS